MIEEVQETLKGVISFYEEYQGQPYECCPTAIRPFVSKQTVESCFKVIDGLKIDFHFGVYCGNDGVFFEIDKSPEHFVNFCIKNNQCTVFCSEHNDQWVEVENIKDLDWVIDAANKVFQ